MGLIWLIGKRLLYAVALITAVLVLNFSLLHLAPGDPADVIAGEMGGATAELLAEIRALYGLDKPFIVQLGSYIGKVLRFDLGYSFFLHATSHKINF